MSAKFTPGPWYRPQGSVGIYTNGGALVARVADLRLAAVVGALPAQGDSGAVAADGDLIAAAPQLYAAVQRLTDYMEQELNRLEDDGGECEGLRAEIAVGRAALDRATGKDGAG